MEDQTIICKKLIAENEELKRDLTISLNKPLTKKLNEALERINSGDYVTENEFFKD